MKFLLVLPTIAVVAGWEFGSKSWISAFVSPYGTECGGSKTKKEVILC